LRHRLAAAEDNEREYSLTKTPTGRAFHSLRSTATPLFRRRNAKRSSEEPCAPACVPSARCRCHELAMTNSIASVKCSPITHHNRKCSLVSSTGSAPSLSDSFVISGKLFYWPQTRSDPFSRTRFAG